MTEQAIKIYLTMLNNKITKVYNIPMSEAKIIVEHSPIKQLLQTDPECITHYSLRYWADFLYNAWVE